MTCSGHVHYITGTMFTQKSSLDTNENNKPPLCRGLTGAKLLLLTHHFFPDPGHCSFEAGYPLPLVCWAAHVIHRVMAAVSFIQLKAARLFPPQPLARRLRHCGESLCRKAPLLGSLCLLACSRGANKCLQQLAAIMTMGSGNMQGTPTLQPDREIKSSQQKEGPPYHIISDALWVCDGVTGETTHSIHLHV